MNLMSSNSDLVHNPSGHLSDGRRDSELYVNA